MIERLDGLSCCDDGSGVAVCGSMADSRTCSDVLRAVTQRASISGR